MDILKGKRYDVMLVLWSSDKPLSANEIHTINSSLKMPTIRRILEDFLKENIIEVAGLSMSGRVYARAYRPMITQEEYLRTTTKEKSIKPVDFLSAMLEDNDISMETLEELQQLLDKKKAEIER